MARFWLTPVTYDDKLVLRGERVLCVPFDELHAFRERLAQVQARALPMFKAALLPDEDDDYCGSDEGLPGLDDGETITFDGETLRLSHCAVAFLDRLPDAAQCLAWIGQSGLEHDGSMPQVQREWLRLMVEWLENGYQVMLLRED